MFIFIFCILILLVGIIIRLHYGNDKLNGFSFSLIMIGAILVFFCLIAFPMEKWKAENFIAEYNATIRTL